MTYIYFIRRDEHVKIGISRDPEGRYMTLNTASHVPMELLGAVPGDNRLERAIHERFKASRSQGEWFRLDIGLRSFIDAILLGGIEAVKLQRFKAPSRARPNGKRWVKVPLTHAEWDELWNEADRHDLKPDAYVRRLIKNALAKRAA